MRWRILLVILLCLSGCGGKGGVKDTALVAQAVRALTAIRNSLEEYYIDNGSYPGEMADLKEALGPYFLRVVFNEGEDIPRHFVTLTRAKNNLTQAREFLTEYEGEMKTAIADSLLRSRLATRLQEIQHVIVGYEGELEGKTPETVPRYPADSFEDLEQAVMNLDFDGLHATLRDSLIAYGDRIVSGLRECDTLVAASLKDTTKREELRTQVESVADSWSQCRAALLDTSLVEGRFAPAAEIIAIRGILPKGDTLLPVVEEMVGSYSRVEQQREAVPKFKGAWWRVRRAKGLLTEYEDELKTKASKVSLIVRAQADLTKIAQAIEAYGGRKGSYPRDGTDLERFFREEFVEVMPELAAKGAYALGQLAGAPSYSTSDPRVGFRLDGNVDDEDRTSVLCDVRIVSEWDKNVSTFSEGPLYATIDSTITYFIRVKANDSSETPLSTRPAVVRKKVEKEDDKEKKKKKRGTR